jgi:hypothetical protein
MTTKITSVRPWLCLLLIAGLLSCSKSGDTVTPPAPPLPPTPPPATITPLITLPPGWKINTAMTATFPNNVQLYVFDSTWGGRQTRAYCFAYESGNPAIEFKPLLSATAKTPAEFVQQEPGTVYACINGGYFGSNQSYSLVKYNNAVSAPNIKSLSRPFGYYYPTRAAFGMLTTGAPSVAWIYHVGSGNDNIFGYPSPSPNDINTQPLGIPDATFPAGGAPWNITSGIGGSPVLVYNNEIRITDKEELIDINNTGSRPRSAIGYTASGVVLLLAVQGDNFVPGYAGLNLSELASMLKSLGCSHAMNLDGGGSTSMLAGGQQTVKPSATGVERAVVSVVMVKKK